MMTREIKPSAGDVQLAGKSVWDVYRQKHYDEAKLSCCLQFESLSEYMTGREHLELYIKLRRGNLHPDQVNALVNHALRRMNLEPHADKYDINSRRH